MGALLLAVLVTVRLITQSPFIVYLLFLRDLRDLRGESFDLGERREARGERRTGDPCKTGKVNTPSGGGGENGQNRAILLRLTALRSPVAT